MQHISSLDDPEYAAFAWARYRRLMRGMVLFSAAATGVVLAYLKVTTPHVPWLIMLMIFVGLLVTLSLTAALMGLVFLSSGTGHDEAVMDIDPVEP